MTYLFTPAARREFAVAWQTPLLAAAAIGVGMMGIGFYALGLFVPPLQAEFGWSRAAVSGTATFQQLGIFVSAPLVGLLADRFGVRAVALASYVATPVALLALSIAGPSIAGWYALWFLISLAGCGTTPVIWARLVTTRFDQARGLALGVMLLGTGVAAILAPALLGPIFATEGWRVATRTMAAAVAVIGIPAALLIKNVQTSSSVHGSASRSTFDANRQTVTIQLIALLLGAIVAGMIIHLVPLLVDRGMPVARAARMAAVIGLAVLLARVVVGYLFDRFHAPYVASIFLIAPVISAVLLLVGGPVTIVAFLLGIAAGAEVDMLAYFISRYARSESYNVTYGVTLGIFCLGAAFGPPLFGWAVDISGGYAGILAGSAFGLTVVVGLVGALGPYRTPKEPVSKA